MSLAETLAPAVPQAPATGSAVGRTRSAAYAALAALGLMLLLPYHVVDKAMPVPSFHAEALAAALGLLAISIAAAAGAGRMPVPRVVWLPAAFIVLVLVQTLAGKVAFYQQGLLGSLYLLWAAGLMAVGALLRHEVGLERVAVALAWFLLAGGLVSSVVGLMQFYESYGIAGAFVVVSSGTRVWGNLAQPNHLADYLGMALASTAFLYATGRLRLVYALPAGATVVHVLSLTGSRAGILYVAALIGLALVVFLRERTVANRRLVGFGLCALVGYYLVPSLVAQLVGGPEGATALERIRAGVHFYEQRPRLWYVGWRLFLDAPLFGQGFREYGWHYFLLNAELPAPRVLGFNDHAHNLVLNVMAEFGLVGLVVLLSGGLAWLLAALRQPLTLALWWALAVLAVIGLHSMVEYPLWYAFFLGPAALLLGLTDAQTVEWRAAPGRMGRSRALLASMLVLGWLGLAQLWRDYLELEGFLAYRYRYVHATEEVNRRAKEALLDLHRTSLLSPLVELGLARTIHISTDHLQDKLTVNARAMQAYPISDVVYRHAMLLALAGDQAGARAQWDRAVAAFPEDESESGLVLRRRLEDGLAGLAGLRSYVAARGY
jgi:O-antigen ligase